MKWSLPTVLDVQSFGTVWSLQIGLLIIIGFIDASHRLPFGARTPVELTSNITPIDVLTGGALTLVSAVNLIIDQHSVFLHAKFSVFADVRNDTMLANRFVGWIMEFLEIGMLEDLVYVYTLVWVEH